MRTTARRYLLAIALSLCAVLPPAVAAHTDTDRDGLSDELEQRLLQQFAPVFMLDKADCAGTPVTFAPDRSDPAVANATRTIYGQVFPARTFSNPASPLVEIHFYHLWSRDCGPHGHRLDAEHVSVLVQASGPNPDSSTWNALYWFAAAHEDTVCQVSQIGRASSLLAESQGAMVWVSSGKHASFLRGDTASHGCGKDNLGDSRPLTAENVVNLGEPGFPMNGAIWASSPQWPLAAKMARSDFPAEAIARADSLRGSEIAWASAGRHPAQGVIAISGTTADALDTGRKDTANALTKSYRSAVSSVSKSLDRTAAFLGIQ